MLLYGSTYKLVNVAIIAFYCPFGTFDRRRSRGEAGKKRRKVLFLSAL
jgi:hypothetical protein